MPGLNIPDFAIRYVWIGVLVIFPLVLIFGWLSEIKAGRIKRTPALDAVENVDGSLHKIDYGIISTLSSI